MASLSPNELNKELNRERFSLKYFEIKDLYSICSKTFSARSREASKPRDWLLSWSYRFAIWRASRQRCCQGACQISELLEKSEYESHGFENSWDLAAARRPSVWWIGTLMPYMYRPELVIAVFPFFDNQRASLSTTVITRERHDVWNHREFYCLFNICSGLHQGKHQCLWIPRTRGPVIQKAFPCYDVILELNHLTLVPHICVNESGQHRFR